MCFAAFLMAYDPFGFILATENVSKELWHKVNAPLYESKSLDNVLVILVGDNPESGMPWPPSYENLDDLHSRLIDYKPASIFYDFKFIGGDDELENLAINMDMSAARVGVRTIVASTSQIGDGDDNKCFAGRLNPYIVKPNIEQAFITTLDDHDGYVLEHADPCEPNTITLSPAAMMYQAFKSKNPESNVDIDMERVMVPKWGYKVSDFNLQSSNTQKCQQVPYTHNIWSFVWQGFMNKEEYRYGHCLPIANISMHRFMQLTDNAINNLDAKKAIKNMIENNVVLIGGEGVVSRDLKHTPVYGDVSGVFTHAIAVDNLITLGDDYITYAPSIYENMSWLDVIEICSLIVMLILTLFFASSKEKGRIRASRLFLGSLLSKQKAQCENKYLGILLSFVIAIFDNSYSVFILVIEFIFFISIALLSAYITVNYLHYEPTNFMALILLAFGAHEMASRITAMIKRNAK